MIASERWQSAQAVRSGCEPSGGFCVWNSAWQGNSCHFLLFRTAVHWSVMAVIMDLEAFLVLPFSHRPGGAGGAGALPLGGWAQSC